MAETETLTLLASTAVSSPGADGATVEIEGRQTAARLKLSVTAYAGTGLTINVQRRDVDTDAWQTTNSVTATAVGVTKFAALVGPETRVTYTTDGNVTFSLDGTAHTIYCEPSDITDEIVREQALSELSTTRMVRACLSASDEADGTLNARYDMPITAWDYDLRLHVAELAAARLFTYRGTDPNSPDGLIYDARNAAERWFRLVQAGRVEPNIIDTTPTVYEAGAVVASNTRMGWTG